MSTDPTLRERLQQLRQQSLSLSGALTRAATELQGPGLDPTCDLVEQVQVYRAQFLRLQRELLPQADVQASQTLNVLEITLQAVESRRAALGFLEQFERLEIVGPDPHTSLLAPVRVLCQTLQQSLLRTDADASEAQHALAHDRHPLRCVWRLVTAADTLDDQAWSSDHACLNETFGREFATAVLRGRVRVSARIAPESPPVNTLGDSILVTGSL